MTWHSCNVSAVLQAHYSSGNYMCVYGNQEKRCLLVQVQEIILGNLKAAHLLLLRQKPITPYSVEGLIEGSITYAVIID